MPFTGTRAVVAGVKVDVAAQVCVIVAIRVSSKRSSADSAIARSIIV